LNLHIPVKITTPILANSQPKNGPYSPSFAPYARTNPIQENHIELSRIQLLRAKLLIVKTITVIVSENGEIAL